MSLLGFLRGAARRPGPLAGLLLAAIAATPAGAVCAICNSSVRLDSSLARCFADRVDTELSRLSSEGRGFVIVNLSDCERPPSRGGLPTGGLAAKPPRLDTSFVADDKSLRCLADAVAESAGELDPSRLFNLNQLCP